MIAVRRTGRFGRVVGVATVTAMLLAAVALVGCGGTVQSPGGPSGTGAPEGAEELVVPGDVRTAVLESMKAAGYAVSDTMYVYVNYETPAKSRVLVRGAFNGPKGKDMVPLTFAELEPVANKWSVIEAR
jgi:hypothetical protein